jgi:hypothetical protein
MPESWGAAVTKYKKSPRGRIANKHYQQSDKGKATAARYRKTAKAKARNARYKRSEKGKAAQARLGLATAQSCVRRAAERMLVIK